MKTLFTMLLSLSMSLPLWSQNIAAFSGTKNPTTATVPNISAKPLSRGPGLTVGGGNTFNSGNWATGNKLDHNDYIEWSVTADPGYIININELQISFDRDPDGFSHFFAGNGPAKIRIRSSLDNFKSDLYANDKISNSGQSPNIEMSLVSSTGGTITFRLYGFSSNIGMLGDLGTLDIEGELGEVLGLANTGIRLSGKVTYDGLLYSKNTWTPHPPNSETKDKNVLIRQGIYSVSDHIQTKNLWVDPQAGIVVKKTGAITVHGNMTTADNVVLQSDANSYASLIVKDTISGIATYQRYVAIPRSMEATENHVLLSAPVTGETFNVFRNSNDKMLRNKNKSTSVFGPFDSAKNTYINFAHNDSRQLASAIGYKADPNKNGTYTFNGKVQTDTITRNISHSGTSKSQWNLIGNPYPSYLTLSDFLRINQSQFNPEYIGIYQDDDSDSGSIRNLAYLTVYPNTKVVPGEAFFVASKKNGGKVFFTPQMRSVGSNNEFGIKKDTPPPKVGFITLDLSDGIKNYTTDFYFNDQSTLGMDPGYDAGIYGAEVPKFALYSELVAQDKDRPKLSVQSMPYANLSNSTIIPLGVHANQNQQLRISLKKYLLPKEVEVYLEDRLANSFTLLNSDDYKFVPSADLSGTDRFFLHVVNTALSYGISDFDALQVFTTNRGETLHIKEKIPSDARVTIMDLQERIVLTAELPTEDTAQKRMNLSGLKNGMYIVKVKTGKLEKITYIRIDAHSPSKPENANKASSGAFQN